MELKELLEPVIVNLGYDLVSLKFIGSNSQTLQIMIKRKDGEFVAIGDCQKVSRSISTILDVEDIIKYNYNLEVSSPGSNQ